MKRFISCRFLALLLVFCLIGAAAASALTFDFNNDGKTDVKDLQILANDSPDQQQSDDALKEALGGGDELHKNEEGQWEIWSELGLRNMAKRAQEGETFVLMQDVDMDGKQWTPVENFNGRLVGNLHTISNMKINQDADGNMGFFGSIAEGGYIEYLNVSDMNFLACADAVNIGLLAGTCAGTIDGCTASGFITDERVELPGNVYVGGMAGKMLSGGSIISRDINKLPEEGAEQAINTISAQIGIRFVTESGHIVGIVGDGLEMVDSGTVLQNLTGIMPDPSAIAWVQNGDSWTFPLNLTELLADIRSDGNTVVTLQADLTNTAAINVPYTCTIDCNGYTIRTPENKNNGIQIISAGTDNQIFTLKNGTLKHYEIGVRMAQGAAVLSNMTIIANGGAPLGLYDPTASYGAQNLIENCTLVSKNWVGIAFNNASADLSAVTVTIRDSQLICGKATGEQVFYNRATNSGTVQLENNVDLYTYLDKLTASATIAGTDPVKLDGTATVEAAGLTFTGLNHWTTDETVISTEVIAEVTNADTMVQVTNVSDMLALINPDGNTRIKLVKDMVRNSDLTIPYSCTIDLNGFSITNASGNALTLSGVGTDNTVTTIQNGRLNHGIIGVRVNIGSVVLDDLEIFGIGNCSASVAFYDPDGQYRADNRITGCYLFNPNYINIMYNKAEVDFHETGVSIDNSTLITTKSYAFGVSTAHNSGINELGAGVEIYSTRGTMVNGALIRFEGLMAGRYDEKASLTVEGTTYNDLYHWSTDNQHEDVINILLIGNSLSTTIPEEVYNIAKNAGYKAYVCNLYYPGCKAWQHWDWLQNDVANYQYRTFCDMGNIRNGDMSTIRNALEDKQWDMICYQDFFTKGDAANLEMLYENHQEPAYNMMQYLKTNYPDAKHFYYQHWAWGVGHSSVPNVAAQEAMWQMIETASIKFAADNDFILVPCGAAFEMARDDERFGDTLCQDDKLHDDGPSGGQYLNGCVFFETMFRESCIGDTWRGGNAPSSDEVHRILQGIAHQTIINVHGEDWVK